MRPYRREQELAPTRHEIADGAVADDDQLVAVPPRSAEDVLRQKIWLTNEGAKRINGHAPEYVAEAIGVSVEELFPSEGRCLYIGDPWQKLDRRGVVIVDYEFGPVAEFQADRDSYLRNLNNRLANLTHRFRSLDSVAGGFVDREAKLAVSLAERASVGELSEYEEISLQFLEMKQRVEDEIARETQGREHEPHAAINIAVRDLWYAAVHGARAVDVLDWATELEPEYEAFRQKLPDRLLEAVKEKRLKDKRRQLIEGIRFEITAKEAEVVQAMFPFMPFGADTFDRIVAFWSISTYAFEHLSHQELNQYWQEIYRLLKPGGRAYISPIFPGNEALAQLTLQNFAQSHPDFSYNDDDGQILISKGEVA